MVGCVEDLVAVEVVDIVFGDAVDVCCVGGDGVHGEVVARLGVVDYVGWVIDVAVGVLRRYDCVDEAEVAAAAAD